MGMSHVSVAYNSPCPLSILRNSYVTCHYLFRPHVNVVKVHVALSNLRNGHVALSILGVKGHSRQAHHLYPPPGGRTQEAGSTSRPQSSGLEGGSRPWRRGQGGWEQGLEEGTGRVGAGPGGGDREG